MPPGIEQQHLSRADELNILFRPQLRLLCEQPCREKGVHIPLQANPCPVAQFYTLCTPLLFSQFPSWKGAVGEGGL